MTTHRTADYGIMGGTGVYDPALLNDAEQIIIKTPYGDSAVTLGNYKGKTVAFMPRHGYGHSIAPHKINYQANITAMKQLGVKQVLATAAVGSLQLAYKPGSLILVDDFLDFTKSRPTTFFEEGTVVHVDMTDPYCRRLRNGLANVAQSITLPMHDGGTYVTTEGPRFESPAEIRFYQGLGAAVVGMTSVPEVVLAKEAELCYATVCMVTNYGAGISPTPLTHEEVVDMMAQNVHLIRQLFFAFIEQDVASLTCRCGQAVGNQTPLTGQFK
jgi:5'-methylthioadenosine phosphorylase